MSNIEKFNLLVWGILAITSVCWLCASIFNFIDRAMRLYEERTRAYRERTDRMQP